MKTQIKGITLLTSGTQETSVVVPLKSDSNGMECLSIDKIPRLFLGFPLVGTEAFSFPAVINSFNFTASENRDGVPLGQSDNEANLTNQSVIEEAYALLVKMLKFAGSTRLETCTFISKCTSLSNRRMD